MPYKQGKLVLWKLSHGQALRYSWGLRVNEVINLQATRPQQTGVLAINKLWTQFIGSQRIPSATKSWSNRSFNLNGILYSEVVSPSHTLSFYNETLFYLSHHSHVYVISGLIWHIREANLHASPLTRIWLTYLLRLYSFREASFHMAVEWGHSSDLVRRSVLC